MHWNENIKVFEKDKSVALWNNGILEKIPKENYAIICKLIENNIQLEDVKDLFEIEDDGNYITMVIQMLQNRKMIVENVIKKKNEFKTATLMLTNRCNLSCYHCCQDAVNGKYEDLSTEDIFKIIDKMCEINIGDLTISGGEPLLRDDFQEIIKYISNKMNCTLSLLTNGTLITEKLAEFIEQHFESVSVSLDGSNRELTKIVRGKDIFDFVIEKIKLLKSKKAKNISVSAVLPRIKKIEDDFIGLCNELGVKPLLRTFSLVGRGESGLKKITDEFEKYAEKNNLQFYNKYMTEAAQNIDSCPACIRNFTVDYLGNVYPCNLLLGDEFKIGSIISETDIFSKIFSWSKIEEYRMFMNTPCELCEYKELCWHCISEVYAMIKDKSAFQKRCEIKKKILPKLIWG